MTEAVGTGHACFLCFLPTASASSPHTAWHCPFPTTVFYQHTHPPPLQRNLFHLYKFLIPYSKKPGITQGEGIQKLKKYTDIERKIPPFSSLTHSRLPFLSLHTTIPLRPATISSPSSPSPPISSHPLHPNP